MTQFISNGSGGFYVSDGPPAGCGGAIFVCLVLPVCLFGFVASWGAVGFENTVGWSVLALTYVPTLAAINMIRLDKRDSIIKAKWEGTITSGVVACLLIWLGVTLAIHDLAGAGPLWLALPLPSVSAVVYGVYFIVQWNRAKAKVWLIPQPQPETPTIVQPLLFSEMSYWDLESYILNPCTPPEYRREAYRHIATKVGV